MEPKRLYRSTDDRKVAGVAAGIAAYFELDPLLIRLLFVILTVAGGGGILIYIILWIVTPEQPYYYQKSNNPFNSEAAPQPNPADEFSGNHEQPGTSQSYSSNEPAAKNSPEKNRKKGSLVGGLVLITIGSLFLADELLPNFSFWDFWPVILIVLGAGLLLKGFYRPTENTL